jgi:hypothetical protein
MVNDDKGKKDPGTEERPTASVKKKKSGRIETNDSGKDEGKLTPAKRKVGEPAGNLRRRAEWFQKRHGGG